MKWFDYDAKADRERVRRNRLELLTTLDSWYHKLGEPRGFRWICDKYDALLASGIDSLLSDLGDAEGYSLRCPVCEGLDYPGLSHNSASPECSNYVGH